MTPLEPDAPKHCGVLSFSNATDSDSRSLCQTLHRYARLGPRYGYREHDARIFLPLSRPWLRRPRCCRPKSFALFRPDRIPHRKSKPTVGPKACSERAHSTSDGRRSLGIKEQSVGEDVDVHSGIASQAMTTSAMAEMVASWIPTICEFRPSFCSRSAQSRSSTSRCAAVLPPGAERNAEIRELACFEPQVISGLF
jgi:hypothetical protein